MRRVMLAASWALAALCAAVPESDAAEVAQCVQVASESVPQGVALEVHNTCELAVRCTVRWRVRCDGDAADAAPRNMSVGFELTSDGKRRVTASGEACGAQIWEITDDAWECREVP